MKKKYYNKLFVMLLSFIGLFTYSNLVSAETTKSLLKDINPPLQEKFAIKGSMTNELYQTKYSDLNKVQNEEWNKKYNFKPETNVKHVKNWNEFKTAFTDNNVSKIILDNDISYTSTSTRINRNESLEIDGQGFLLEMRNSSMVVANVENPESFTKKFSDVPVFHMHDLQVINNANQGAVEGNLANAWAMVNGDGYHGDGTGSGKRGIWRYRIGNITTPSDMSASGRKNMIGGRLINADLAEVSVWGWNRISTGAENFYTGGMTYEPYTYYRGEIAYYNYSTIWFKLSKNYVSDTNANKKALTGNGNFEVGTGAFVYLNNTGTGATYPAVYEHFRTIDIGEYATFNANVPGSAVTFNEDGQKFLGRKGSKVNLLSRANNSTILFDASASTFNNPRYQDTRNLSFVMEDDSELYVSGKAAGGVIQFNNRSSTNMELRNLEVFDIANNYNTQRTTNFFGTGNANHKLTITSSDIALWKNDNQSSDTPTSYFSNVESFSVDGNGNVTSSDEDLKNTYIASDYRRISGLNSEPQIEWTPVTDADYSQKLKVLLGNVPVGGSQPYDENGDAITKPVYADDIRKVEVDFKDTLGNTYTGETGSDMFVVWKKEDHKQEGFQKANQLMNAIPYKVDKQKVRYKEGISRNTQVIDVTPPEQAKLKDNNKVTNADRSIEGIDGEPGATVYLSVNGGEKKKVSEVGSDGTWSYNLDKYLTSGDKLVFYMEDKSGKAPESILEGDVVVKLDPSAPTTNNTNGNINPDKETKYRDAIFDPALNVTVKDIIPSIPNITKLVESDTPENADKKDQLTQVGSVLTYEINAENQDTADSEKVLLDTVIEDEIPIGLTFDLSKVQVYRNGVLEDSSDVNYLEYDENKQESTKKQGKLTYKAKNLNPKDKVSIKFPTVVTRKSVGKIINNKVDIIGHSPRLEDINDVNSGNIEVVNTANVNNPGGEVFGILSLVSAPEKFTFGNVKLTDFNKEQVVDMGSTATPVTPMVVEDTRGVKSRWRVTATLIEEMTYTKPGDSQATDVLNRSLFFRYKGNDSILELGTPVTVFDSQDDSQKDEYQISKDFWQKNKQDTTKKDGLKMKAQKVPTANEYKGKLEWAIEDVKTK